MNDHKFELLLNEIKESLNSKAFEQKEILNLEETALFLSISKSTLYKLTHKGIIPFYKPNGKLIFFKKIELLQWIEGSTLIDNNNQHKNAGGK